MMSALRSLQPAGVRLLEPALPGQDLARQRPLNRPFIAFGAIGKASAFLLGLALWFFGEVSATGVALFGGDLALAGLFAWCLAGTPSREAHHE